MNMPAASRSVLILSLLILATSALTHHVAGQEASIVITNVTVIPMNGTAPLEDHTVIVRDGIIAEVVPSGSPSDHDGSTIIDGSGRFLIPGLAEMHGHIPGSTNPQYAEDVLFLYVSNGVTTVRGMAGDPSHLGLRERIARGDLLGPTIYIAGPGLSGSRASSKDVVEQTVREQHEAGYDLLKVFSMPPEVYAHMASTAHELGIPFAGHIPVSVGLTGALEARQASIDHLDRYIEYLAAEHPEVHNREPVFFGSGVIDLADSSRIASAVAATVGAQVWNVPTLSLVEHLASPESPEEMIRWPEMKYMPPNVRAAWVRSKHSFSERADFQPQAATMLVDMRRRLTKALHDGGAMIALGSDAPQFFNVPGFSLHHEMRMMVDAGLTPEEVLVTGTRNPALYFGTPEEFGTIEVGRRADMILLEANPLDDIANVRRRAGVLVRGKWLPESEIRQRLDEIAHRNAMPEE